MAAYLDDDIVICLKVTLFYHVIQFNLENSNI